MTEQMRRRDLRGSTERIGDIQYLLGILLLGLLPTCAPAGAPIEAEASLEQSTLTVGEPLVIDMQITNVSSEVFEIFSFYTRDAFYLTWYFDFISEGCELEIFSSDPLPGDPLGFGFTWIDIPELQPGETATCRVIFPQTLFPGQETVRFASRVDSVLWPDIAELTYTLLPEGQPPRPIPYSSPLWLSFATLLLLLIGLWQLRPSRRAG